MIENFTDYYSGEEFRNVEIVTEDDLPRSCDVVSYVTDEKTMTRYTVYKDCVTRLLYAVKENEE